MGSDPWWQQPSKPSDEPFFAGAADARWLVLEAFGVMLLLPTATVVFTIRAWSDHQALWAGVVLSVAFLLNRVSRRERDHRDRIFTSQVWDVITPRSVAEAVTAAGMPRAAGLVYRVVFIAALAGIALLVVIGILRQSG